MSERFDFTGDELAPAYRAAVDAIEAGDLVVLPTDTVYGLAADAFKADAVQRLLDAKGRGRDMPPPVLISVVESLDALATDIPDDGRKLCEEFWPGPLTVICHAQTSLMWDLGETQGTVALRVPDHENTRELLSRTGPLAVSSANKSGQPAALDVYDAEEQLGESVAVYLDGGEATGGQPSTIVDLTGDTPRVVRVGALSVDQLRAVVPDVATETDEKPAAETPTEDKPADETPAEDKPADETPAEDKPADEKPADEKPADEKPADEKPADEKLAEEKPAEDKPLVDESAEDKPAEDKLAEDKPAEDKPADVEPTAEAVVASKEDDTKTDPDVRPADRGHDS
ncbi:L-threonylcarbamoyladenylate synthase [Kribbella speibonae]|uniref:L-threonylcarbamoyladenylate synthase n=1 Tax=Kribbella speibonae TaxID=1572660 RepID=UPI001EE09107|nr:L-threonylcarbamoyladenylate synthase [Kribbella speibonae]